MRKSVITGLVCAITLLQPVYVGSLFARGKVNNTSSVSRNLPEIEWSKDRKLTWNDFQGSVPYDIEDQTAAATYCGIGFETSNVTSNISDLKIKVYNTFYTGKSWVRPEERNTEILEHEQGHFDLCELYTRKLRERLTTARLDSRNLRNSLANIYEEVQREYRERQEKYEDETGHGVKRDQQIRWQNELDQELTDTEKWSKS
jgi:hypothetical protein